MVGDKCPVEGVPDIAPRTNGEIAHFAEIRGAANVRFCGHQATISILAHPVDVGHHHPVVCINKKFHKPLVNGIRVDPAEAHDVAEDHESFDMVSISGRKGVLDNVIDRKNARCPIVKRTREFASCVERISGSLHPPKSSVYEADIFPPTDHLPNKSFKRIQGDGALVSESSGDDLEGREKADVEGGSKDRMEENITTG